MIKIKGVNIYPSQLEDFLLNIPFIQGFFIELFTDKNLCDVIKILIKLNKQFYYKDKKDKLDDIQNKLKEMFGIKIEIEEVKEHGLEERLRTKKYRFIDRRIKKSLFQSRRGILKVREGKVDIHAG